MNSSNFTLLTKNWVYLFILVCSFLPRQSFCENIPAEEQLTLTCPPDIIVGPLFGECGIYVNFNTLVWSSSTGVQSHSFNVLPIHFFEYGNTPVTLTVIDTLGDESSCTFNVTVNPPPFVFECHPQVILGFDGECEREVTAVDLVDGFRACNEQYDVSIFDNSGNDLGNTLDTGFVGPAWTYLITDLYTDNTCSGVIVVDGNTMDIEITCPDPFTIYCHEPYDSTGVPFVNGCFDYDDYTHTYVDNRIDTYCDGDNIAFNVFRMWTTTDPFGNSASCEQVINATRVGLDDIIFPLNFDGIQQPALPCSPSPNLSEAADTSITGVPSFKGIDPSTVACGITFVITDEETNVCGNHYEIERTWEAYDYCEDESVFHTQIIILEDNTAPIFSVPDTFFLSTIAECGTSYLIPAIDLEDECSNFNLLIETPWQTHGNDDVISQFAKVPGTYNMSYTATDGCGNVSVENAVILVTDGVIARCPENPTITGDYYKDNLEEQLNIGHFAVLEEFGAPEYYTNCSFDPLIGVQVNVSNCYEGELIRTFTVNVEGNDHVCVQTITVEHVTDLNIETIPEIDFHCDGDMIIVDDPVIENVTIEDVSITFSDITLNDPTACYKLVRTWNISNACDPAFGLSINQEINVYDTISPVFTNGCQVPDVCITGENCFADISFQLPETDDCSEPITIEKSIFINGAWLSAPAAFNDAILGEYDIRFVATDRCFNKTTCTSTVTVVDCQPPVANCEDVVLANIQIPTPPATVGFVTVSVSELNNLSYDNCTGVLGYSFAETFTSVNQNFTCSDLGINPTVLWVTDDFGNKDSCTANVVIIDDFDVCDTGDPFLGGTISTEYGDGISNVVVSFSDGTSNTTDMVGAYLIPISSDPLSITPIKNEDHDNGVTTFDLVVLTRHILGIAPLDSPYKIIAADANNSNSVTTFDAVEIRRLILGIYDEFPDITSWRFVPSDYDFVDPTNPFSPVFPEVININSNPPANENYDFIGMKIGDLNGSANTDVNGNLDERNENETFQ